MGVPKSKRSRMRARRTRAHLTISLPNLERCPNCGSYKLPHRACQECGYYRGEKFIKSAQEIREERAKKKEEREQKT